MAKKALTVRWIPFAIAVPFCFYASFYGVIFMGFCPGFGCFPHTWAWILATPLLLLAIWSLRATAGAMVALLAIHVALDVSEQGFSVNTLWGADKGLDIALWIAVALVVVAALIPPSTTQLGESSAGDTL